MLARLTWNNPRIVATLEDDLTWSVEAPEDATGQIAKVWRLVMERMYRDARTQDVLGDYHVSKGFYPPFAVAFIRRQLNPATVETDYSKLLDVPRDSNIVF